MVGTAFALLVQRLGSPQGDLRKDDTERQPDELKADERKGGPPDLPRRDAQPRSSHSREIIACVAERRREKGDLHIHTLQDAKPDRVEAQVLDDRNEDWDAEHEDADPVQKATQEEENRLHEEEDPPGAEP